MTALPTSNTQPPSLDEILDTYSADTADEGFAIDSEQKAIWAAEKLVAVHAEIEGHREAAARRIELMQSWLADVTKPLNDRAEYFTGLLEWYHRALLAEDAKKKTVKLPGVQLKARAAQDSWTFDPDAFVAWADERAPDLVRVKREPNAVEAKKVLTAAGGGVAVDADGVVVPGVVVTSNDTKFSVVVS